MPTLFCVYFYFLFCSRSRPYTSLQNTSGKLFKTFQKILTAENGFLFLSAVGTQFNSQVYLTLYSDNHMRCYEIRPLHIYTNIIHNIYHLGHFILQ